METPQEIAKKLKAPVSVDLDAETGLVTYKGQILTYRELQYELEQDEMDLADLHYENRDYFKDGTQNTFGNKHNKWRDDWYYLKKPIKRPKGYPIDTEGYYESVPAPLNNIPDEHGNV